MKSLLVSVARETHPHSLSGLHLHQEGRLPECLVSLVHPYLHFPRTFSSLDSHSSPEDLAQLS